MQMMMYKNMLEQIDADMSAIRKGKSIMSYMEDIGIELVEVVLCQEKVQIKYALLMLSYPAKASALSSNAA